MVGGGCGSRVACLDLGHVECITVFSWRASRVDVGELFREVHEGSLGSARLVISHEMKGIERLEFLALSEVCGDALRVCRSHLKGFVVARSGGYLLYLTSANFNRNGRNESFELHVGGSEYPYVRLCFSVGYWCPFGSCR